MFFFIMLDRYHLLLLMVDLNYVSNMVSDIGVIPIDELRSYDDVEFIRFLFDNVRQIKRINMMR